VPANEEASWTLTQLPAVSPGGWGSASRGACRTVGGWAVRSGPGCYWTTSTGRNGRAGGHGGAARIECHRAFLAVQFLTYLIPFEPSIIRHVYIHRIKIRRVSGSVVTYLRSRVLALPVAPVKAISLRFWHIYSFQYLRRRAYCELITMGGVTGCSAVYVTAG
jgi:hypothetical protein